MLLTVQGISFSKHMELKLTPYFYPGRRESFPKPTGIRAAAQCVLGKAGHCLHQARCPEPTHSNFPSPKGSLAPAAPCSRQTLSRKEQTKGSHKSLQPISPKFSGGMGFKHPFTAQGACAPGACEKTAGGITGASSWLQMLQAVLGSANVHCSSLSWPWRWLCPPFLRMEPYRNMGRRREPQRMREARNISACLVPSWAFWFCLKHCAMSPRLFLSWMIWVLARGRVTALIPWQERLPVSGKGRGHIPRIWTQGSFYCILVDVHRIEVPHFCCNFCSLSCSHFPNPHWQDKGECSLKTCYTNSLLWLYKQLKKRN